MFCMKAKWTRLCAFILTILGFTSCCAARKAAKEAAAKEKEAAEQSDPKSDADTVGVKQIPVKPEIRVMYGPPPSYFRKVE